MPQTPPAFFKLRQKLNALLADELGVFSNGEIALWIEPPRIPAKLSSSGLLCKISRYELLNSSTHSHSSQQALRNYDWQVHLIQYDTSSSGLRKLDLAKRKMEQAFPRQKQVVLVEVDGVYPQIRFLLNFSEYVNTCR